MPIIRQFHGWDDPDGQYLQGEPKPITINLQAVGCVIPKTSPEGAPGCEIIVQGRPLWIDTNYEEFCKLFAEAHGLAYTPDP